MIENCGLCIGVGIAITLIGLWPLAIFIRKWAQGKQFVSDVRIDDKVVIITGANTGIGKQTAIDLAKRGAKIYLACRNFDKCEEARKEIIELTGNKNVFNRELDLSSLESVRKFSEKFLKEEKRLDILINNAGIMICPKSLTKDGFETQIGVNHMGHFLLTNLLLDLLKKSSPSRIVVLSSLAHIAGYIKKDDLNSEKSYNRILAYGQSKLANILFTRHLAKMLNGTGVTIYCVHPGSVNTELMRHVPSIFDIFVNPFKWLLFKTPISGAQTTLRCAVDPVLEKVTGKYYSDCEEKWTTKLAKDDDMAEWLWKTSEEWTKLKK